MARPCARRTASLSTSAARPCPRCHGTGSGWAGTTKTGSRRSPRRRHTNRRSRRVRPRCARSRPPGCDSGTPSHQIDRSAEDHRQARACGSAAFPGRPRIDTPCVDGLATREEERRVRPNPGVFRRVSSTAPAAEFARSADVSATVLAGVASSSTPTGGSHRDRLVERRWLQHDMNQVVCRGLQRC